MYIFRTALARVDYRDADGWVDSWPACSALQEFVRWTVIPGAALAGLLAIAAVAAVS